ncbi:carbohydrate kinase [Sinorhizobium numidicum]|uniref:Carbohydrate kinase n=1 Tax=Sinorhizobium numidicum TaxID=680248 RepID=A0ABY8D0J1_9HYPH|nr:FGGY-family carbohydrate kinase [Sinorhizobium numidicum]WEX76404.1 carbohydrate kinase [Sinorhizobium numidicum]WEX83065.1 carbohydrate kinase [Sinorhizobium numidicum]
MRDILIGIDAGTSVIKSVAFDLGGRQLAMATVPNSYEAAGRTGSVQDLRRTWTDAVKTLVDLAARIENLPGRVAAIAVTGQGDGTWMIDRDGEPVGKGWLWLDARASETVERLRGESGDAERFSRTGSGLAACQQGPQLRWMMDKAPEMLEGAATAFHCKDWLYFNLTGKRATDPSEANFTFGDFRTRQYSDEVISFLGLESLKHLLPEIVDGATSHHALSKAAAAVTGIPAGTPVVLGYVDVVCTALGAGLYDPGTDTGCSIIGSTGMHMRLATSAEDVRLNSDLTGYTMCMPIPNTYTQMQSNLAATLNIDWILSVAASVLKGMGIEKSKGELLAHVDGWLAEAKDTPLLFQPYISDAGERGPFVDASARASFVGLSMTHGFGDMVRAVFDGLALAARDCYSEMGPLPRRIRLTGGAARSAALRQILGGALGASVQTSEREEAGAAGAAMIAAVSLGIYPSMADCVRDWATPYQRAAEAPDERLVRRYDRLFPSYQQSRLALRPVWHALSQGAAGADQQERSK